MSELKKMLEFATETAFQAGQLTLAYFQTGIQPDFKADDSPVTLADKKAEELIRLRIEKTYPHHGIVGEEFGETNPGASHRWFIDPIDGTKAFMKGVPLYAVLIGLEIDGCVEVGVSYFPGVGDMVYAASHEGCYWNGRRAFVSNTQTLDRAYFSHTDIAAFAKYGRAEALERILKSTYHRVGWSDAYGHMLVATGRVDIMIDPIMNPWDCGPFPVLLREAGGYFGDLQGKETIYGSEALSTSKTLLADVLKLIQDQDL